MKRAERHALGPYGQGILLFIVGIMISGCSVVDRKSQDPALSLSPEGRRAFTYVPVQDRSGTSELPPVYFATASSRLTPQGRTQLRKNAEWLRRNPHVMVQIEGYCDPRGSEGYNFKLAEKRAQSARNYLIRLGISPNRLGIHNHGRVDTGKWDSNRRASFILIYPTLSEPAEAE